MFILLLIILLLVIVQGLITFELIKDVDYILEQLEQLEEGETNE